MKCKKVLFVLICCLGLLAVLAGVFVIRYGKAFGLYLKPPTPAEYVDDALSFMDNGMYAHGDDWRNAKASARERAQTCSTYEETYDIIQDALMVAGGKHSAINPPSTMAKLAAEQTMPQVSFDEGILYVQLPPYTSGSNLQLQYIDAVTGPVQQHASEIRGLVLDMRDNTGGDMGAMIAAVSPFLPDGMLMQFSISGQVRDATLNAGTVTGAGTAASAGYTDKICVPVAILQNEWTASSGEATLICFKGLDRVQTFGSPTAGYASCNTVRRLYDGATIQLTIGCDVDRAGNTYCDDPIPPDVATDTPLEDARAWINQESIFNLSLHQ